MKLINILTFAGVLSAAALQSCNYTDLQPETFVGEEVAFKNVESVGKVVTGAYGTMSLRSSMAISEYIADDVVQGSDAGGTGTNLYAWTYADDGESANIWSQQYSIINNANRIIHYGAEVTPQNEAEVKQLDNYIGQAYFLRAFAHFELLRFFSYFQNEDELGIPYVSYPHVLGLPARDLVEDCYDNILNDLATADEMITNTTDKAYATPAAIQALMARVSLYRKDYSRALICANEALKLVPMETAANFEAIWTDKSRDGVIFVLPRFKGNTPIGGLFIGSDNSSVFRPSTKYMNSYLNKDVRKSIYFGKGPDRSGETVDRVHKYSGTSATVGLNDEKVLRSAEMKIIVAEAYAHLNEIEKANKTLNEIRALRIEGWTDLYYPYKEMLLDEILKERRWELAFENHRFFDLRRYNKDIVRDNGKTLKADHFRMVMPIPRAELQANENIKDQQNIGY